MKNRLRNLSKYFLIVGLILVLGGITYAFFSYSTFGHDSVSLNGQVYMRMVSDSNNILLYNVFPEPYEDVIAKNDNYIDFTIIGKNTYRKPVYYEIDLEYGTQPSCNYDSDPSNNKTRIDDEYLRFDLIDITDIDNPINLLSSAKFDSIDDRRIYVSTIDPNQLKSDEPVSRTFRLRMYYDENILISDTDPNRDFYASEERASDSRMVYSNLFSSARIKVYGDFIEKNGIFAYLKNQVEDQDEMLSYSTTEQNYYGWWEGCFSLGEYIGNESSIINHNLVSGNDTKYTKGNLLFPQDYYNFDENGVPSLNENSFSMYAPYVEYIEFKGNTYNGEEFSLEDLREDPMVVYFKDLSDYEKSNNKVYMVIFENGRTVESHPSYCIGIFSDSIIMFPENSKGMFAWYEEYVDYIKRYVDLQCYLQAIDNLASQLDYSLIDPSILEGADPSQYVDRLKQVAYESFISNFNLTYVEYTTIIPIYYSTGNNNNAIKVEATRIFNQLYPNGYNNDSSIKLGTIVRTPYFSFRNLKEIVFDNICTSDMTNMDSMFMDCSKLEYLDLSLFDTRNVTSMDATFCGVVLDELDVSNFDTRNVTCLRWCFGCSDIGDVIGTEKWNVNKVTDYAAIFSNAEIGSISLAGWNVSTGDFQSLTPANASGYNASGDVPSLNYTTPRFENLSRTSFGGAHFGTLNLSGWNFNNNKNCYDNISSSTWSIYVDNLIMNNSTFNGPYNKINLYNTKIIDFNGTKFINDGSSNCISPFNINSNQLEEIDYTNCKIYGSFNDFMKYSDYIVDITKVDFSNMTSLARFFSDYEGSTVDFSLFNFDFSKIKSFDSMFKYANNVVNVTLPVILSSSVTNMKNVFDSCSSLKTVNFSGGSISGNNIDLTKMFYKCPLLESVDFGTLSINNVANTTSMFEKCTNLATIHMDTINLDSIQITKLMFSECSNLEDLTIDNSQMNNLTDCNKMFYSCSKLPSINLSNATFLNVTNSSKMFYYCNNMTSINLSGLGHMEYNTNAEGMFMGCRLLRDIDLGNGDFSACTNFNDMFNQCYVLEKLDISSFNTYNATTMNYIFLNLNNIERIYVSPYDPVNHTGWTIQNLNTTTGLYFSKASIEGVAYIDHCYINNYSTTDRLSGSQYFQIYDGNNDGYLTDVALKEFLETPPE